MKSYAFAVAAALALATAGALAQSGGMKGMDHNAMSKGDSAQATHKAVGVVKKVDPKAGTVSLAHGPIKSLNWPAMTMGFQVKDKALFDKLALNKKVEFEFEQRGKDYVITNVK